MVVISVLSQRSEHLETASLGPKDRIATWQIPEELESEEARTRRSIGHYFSIFFSTIVR